MDNTASIVQLKDILQKDISSFCSCTDRMWNGPIACLLNEIAELGFHAVIFGGTLRTLLLSRLNSQKLGRPRDVDIVVTGGDINDLKHHFNKKLSRETRFGGLQIHHEGWDFDIWPLNRTWAFIKDNIETPQFEHLPSTTFFNLEAIAVEIEKRTSDQTRTIHSGDDQFFKGILSKTLEMNREDNPFPALCVVRSFVMASSTQFSIGPRLTQYLVRKGPSLTDRDLIESQIAHYGQIRGEAKQIRYWLENLWSASNKDIKIRQIEEPNRVIPSY